MHPKINLNSSAYFLIGWIVLIALSVSGQINSTNNVAPASAAPTSTISDISNSTTNQLQDARALAEKAEQIRADCVNGRRHVCGRVLQIVPGGLVVDSGYTDLLRPELSQSWFAPGTVSASRPPNLVEEKTPGSVCVGLVFLADVPKRPAVKAYDYVIIEAYPAGQYDYAPLPGVTKTIRRFSAKLEGALQLNLAAVEK
jgi:hypothetical protein